MSNKDPELGRKIHEYLVSKDIETPMQVYDYTDAKDNDRVRTMKWENEIASHFHDVMKFCLHLNMEDDSLKDTPRRVAKMYCEEIFGGLNYDNFPKCTAIENKMGFDEVVLVRDITLRSTCEHHFQPIYGRAHIAYIPNGKVLGLSKLERVTSFFAARPQVQERLTEQVYAALSYILGTESVGVVIAAEHFCMKMRGVKDANSNTVTSKMGGLFRENSDARRELLSLIGAK